MLLFALLVILCDTFQLADMLEVSSQFVSSKLTILAITPTAIRVRVLIFNNILRQIIGKIKRSKISILMLLTYVFLVEFTNFCLNSSGLQAIKCSKVTNDRHMPQNCLMRLIAINTFLLCYRSCFGQLENLQITN